MFQRLLFFFFCIVAQLTVLISSTYAQSKQPNIVFIISDSHRGEALGINGHPFVKTPHLDALAKQGTRFTHTYVTTAICSVSRASILSGQHKARHGINDFVSSFSEQGWMNTYPLLLKKAGYTIGQIGFLGVGKQQPTDYFDHWEGEVPWLDANGVHHTDQIVEKGIAYLEKQKQIGNQPFYVALSFNAAHEIDGKDGKPATYLVQERFKDLYKEVTIPEPQTAAPQYWEQFPDFFRTDQNIGRGRWHGLFSTPELFQENVKNYYRLVTGIDEAVGKVVAKLNELGLDENTIVVYTSDHGFSLGEHGMMGKWYGFEKGIHVPLIIHDPRKSQQWRNKTIDQLSLNIDLAPTLLSLAGVNIPTSMQGHDLFEVAKGNQPARKHFLYEHTVFASPLLPKVQGLIGKDFKYFYYPEHQYEAYYDTKKHPNETHEVAKDPSYGKRLAQVRKLFEAELEAVR